MTAFVIITFIALLVIFASGNKKKAPKKKVSKLSRDIATDDSIIDVTGKSYPINLLLTALDNEPPSKTEHSNYIYNGNQFQENYWGLGSRYQAKLSLDGQEVNLLNKLYPPDNNFCTIDFCCAEVVKLFLNTVKSLNEHLKTKGITHDKYVKDLAELIIKKQFRFREGSSNYRYAIAPAISDLYTLIFKNCENAVREQYGHKRKINADADYKNDELKKELDLRLFSLLPALIRQSSDQISAPDEATEIELYAQNTARWKQAFEKITARYDGQPGVFFEAVLQLGSLNNQNPSVENIFFEASKFIAKHDKETALKLYLHYLYIDLRSASVDNKPLTKTIQKSLFKTNEQLHDFETIVSELIKDRSLEKALKKIPGIYKVKRKKITLDSASIIEAKQEHSGTVELLNDYLKDEDENTTITVREINPEEVSIQIVQKDSATRASKYITTVVFSTLQQETLDIFVKSNFSIPQAEMDIFTKSNGVFKSQLIESINDICFETLDDVLIEEEDDHYIINPGYYQQLLLQC